MVGKTNSVIVADNINHSGQQVIFVWARQSTGSSSDPPSSNRIQLCDNDYFSVSAGVFTAKKAFTGKLFAWALSGRDGSGNANTLTINVYKNSTSVLNGSTNNSYTSSGSGTSVTVAVGDTLKITGTHSHGGTHQCTLGFVFTL